MQKIDLSILPQGKLNPIVRCSQGDVGRQFQVELYNEDMSAKYILDGTETLTVEGHKPDGNFFSFDLPATTGSVITVTTTEQMTACYGDVYGEIRIEKGSILLGTANFTLAVEIGASAEDTVSISALQFIDALRNEMNQAIDDAENYADDSKAWAVGPNGSGTGTDTNNSKYYSGQSANSATASANSANDSKNWAVGPSGSGSGTDSNNSKYYSQQSASSASSASSSASDAKNWAVGPSGSGSGTDSNNSKYYAGQASQSATDASGYANDASGYATNASNSANAASGSASDAKSWAVGPSGTGTGTDSNNAKYYAQQSAQSATDADNAKDDAVTAKNAAESAQQKIENMTASASGLPAGSSPTVTKTEVGGVVNLGFGIPKGDKGDTGNDGVSPTASVTQTDPDTVTFTVTDGQGTTTATLSAGGAPALAGLSDVNLTTPSDGQALVYDNNSSKWVNGQAGVAAPYQYGQKALRAGKISGYNGASEYIDNTVDPVSDITATDNVAWFIGMPIEFQIDNNNDNIHYRCELVDYRATLYIGGDGYDVNNPAVCMHNIAVAVASGEEGLAYDFELYFLIPDNTGRLVKVDISYDTYGNMTSHTTTYVSAGGGGSTNIIADDFDTTATTTPKTYPEYSVVSYNGNGYFNGTTPTSATPPASPWQVIPKDAVPSYGGTVAFDHCAEDSNGDIWQNTDTFTQSSQWFNPASPDTTFFTKLDEWVADETTYHSYYVGDYVIYNGGLYKCVVDTTGQAWDGNAWSATQVCDELSSGGGGGGANETYIDWSQDNSYRWRVNRFFDTAYTTGVEIEINTAQFGIWSSYTVDYGNSLVSDYDNRTYQLIQIDVPLSALVLPDAYGNVTAIVEGTTYTFNLNSDIALYDNYPFLVQFSPPALFGSLPNPSFLQKSAGVEGTTAYLTVTADGPVIRLSFYLRTDMLVNTFSDLMSVLGMSSFGGVFGPICGSLVLSKSKS